MSLCVIWCHCELVLWSYKVTFMVTWVIWCYCVLLCVTVWSLVLSIGITFESLLWSLCVTFMVTFVVTLSHCVLLCVTCMVILVSLCDTFDVSVCYLMSLLVTCMVTFMITVSHCVYTCMVNECHCVLLGITFMVTQCSLCVTCMVTVCYLVLLLLPLKSLLWSLYVTFMVIFQSLLWSLFTIFIHFALIWPLFTPFTLFLPSLYSLYWPLSLVPLRDNKILALSDRQFDVYWRHTGEHLQTYEFTAKKSRVLLKQFDDVIAMTKVANDTSNIYLIRSLGERKKGNAAMNLPAL